MTIDTRQILLTATTYDGQTETANIVGNAPATSEIASGIPGNIPAVTETNDVALNVVVTGMGEENVPDPRLFKFLADQFGFSEQKLFDVFKSLSNLTTTDEQVRKLLQKVLEDITSNSDVFDRVWDAYRTFTDSTTNSERLEQDFAKVLSDVSNSSDLLRTDVGKYLADVTALANLSYAVMLVGKTLDDQTIGFSDVLDRIVDFNRTFEDSVFMTDDFLGDANIDDDQYAQVFKVVLEWISLPETFAVDVTKPDLQDQATLAEQAYLATEIPKTDQFVNSDLQFATVELVKSDQTTNSEQQVFNITKPDRTDTATTSEQQAFDVTKPDRTDQATLQDQVTNTVDQTSNDSFTSQIEEYYFDIDKPDLTDQALVTDQPTLDFTRPADDDQLSISELLLTKLIGLNINEIDYFLEDYVFDITDYTFKAVHALDQITQVEVTKLFDELVDATDDFYGAANIDDDQIATVDKVVADYGTFSDTFDRLVYYIRLFTETATMLEQAELDATKVLADQTANAELVDFDNHKVTSDQATIQENTLFDVEQISADQITSSEQAYLDVVSAQSDNITNTDDFSRFFEAVRIFTEQTQTTELVEQLVERVSSDQATFIELVTQTVEKLSLDQAATSEEQTFDFSAVYNDLVDATDDFYGAANIDDDQIATVDKVLVDYAINSETITTVVEFYRTFLEVAINTDLAVFDFAKSVLDIVTTSETVAIDFATSREETTTTSETVEQDFSTSRTEIVTQSDLFTQSIEPAKYEIVTTSEDTIYDVSLDKPETVVTSETTSVDFVTERTEVAAILELFVSQWDAYKSFIETVTQTDLVDLHTGKPATDTTTTSDTQVFDTTKRPLDTAQTSEVVGKDATTELFDLVDATDDFFGAATIGDDEYFTIDKVLAEYATNSDVLTTLTDFFRSVNENQILSEVFAAATDKALSDITNSSDTVTLLTAPTKLESVSTSQTISLTLQSYFSQDYVELGYTGETYTY
jgi:hypothetical protein